MDEVPYKGALVATEEDELAVKVPLITNELAVVTVKVLPDATERFTPFPMAKGLPLVAVSVPLLVMLKVPVPVLEIRESAPVTLMPPPVSDALLPFKSKAPVPCN